MIHVLILLICDNLEIKTVYFPQDDTFIDYSGYFKWWPSWILYI